MKRTLVIAWIVLVALTLLAGCRSNPTQYSDTGVGVGGAECWAASVRVHGGTPLDPVAVITCDKTSAAVGATINITVALSVPTTEATDCPAAVATIKLAPGLSPVSASGDKGQITCLAPTMTSAGNPVTVTLIGPLPVIDVMLAIPAPSGNAYTIPLGALVRGGPAATIKIKATVL